MLASKLERTNRLRSLREDLTTKKVDLQRVYNFTFTSLKLGILFRKVAIRVVSVTHPYINFENQGDWKGFIGSATKPSDMTLTFLEDDSHIVNGAMELWNQLKYNNSTGIHYPKAVYEDQGMLVYHGPKMAGADHSGPVSKYPIKTRTYALIGLYPIKVDDVTLDYSSNDVLKLSVPFNVDEIKPLHVLGVGT